MPELTPIQRCERFNALVGPGMQVAVKHKVKNTFTVRRTLGGAFVVDGATARAVVNVRNATPHSWTPISLDRVTTPEALTRGIQRLV